MYIYKGRKIKVINKLRKTLLVFCIQIFFCVFIPGMGFANDEARNDISDEVNDETSDENSDETSDETGDKKRKVSFQGGQKSDHSELSNESSDSSRDYTLDDLFELFVYSPSRSNVELRKSPGTVRVFTREDFESFGFRTLKDVLASVPGIQVESYMTGGDLIWVRGVQSRQNNKVLLLIDGIPFRENWYGSFHIDEMISLDSIEKIEVISGPGSVLYGTNAFAGVISITTRKEVTLGEKYGAATKVFGNMGHDWDYQHGEYGKKGRYGYGGVNAQLHYKHFYLYGEILEGSIFNPQLTRDGEPFVHNQETEKQMLSLAFQNSFLKVTSSIINYSKPYVGAKVNEDQQRRYMPIFGGVELEKDFGEFGLLSGNVYYDYQIFKQQNSSYIDDASVFDKDIEFKEEETFSTIITGMDLFYSYMIFNNDIKLGISYMYDAIIDDLKKRTTEPGNINGWQDWTSRSSKAKRTTVGVILQDMWHINDDHMLTAGIRYDYLSEYKNQFNYRFAYGGQYRDLYGKILFGTAYRVPVYREYLKIGVENPNLRPEKLRTFETQIGYIFTRADLSLTYYYNHYTDFIDEVSVVEINGETLETPDEYSINLKVRRISGLEFNSTIYPVSDLTLKFSADYLLLAKEEIGEIKGVETEFDYNINPRSLFFLDGFSTRLLASYRFLDKFNVGFNVTYKGKKQTPPNYQEDSVKKTNSNADGYLRMDINGSIDFNRHFQLHGKVSNVIGTRAYSPPYSKIEKYDTELPGRSVYVGLRLKY